MNKFLKKCGAVIVGSVATVSSAFAAVPAGVTTALTDLEADAVTVAIAFLVAGIAVKAIHIMRRG